MSYINLDIRCFHSSIKLKALKYIKVNYKGLSTEYFSQFRKKLANKEIIIIFMIMTFTESTIN